MATQFYPGQTLGIIGEGINGPILAQTARRMGFRVAAYSFDKDAEVLHVADLRFVGANDNWDQLRSFAESCDFVTYESQNISSETLEYIKQYTDLPQGVNTLEISMDRLMERTLFESLNINCLPYTTVVDLTDVVNAAASLGYPVVLKSIPKITGIEKEVVVENEASIGKVADMIDTGTFIIESWLSNVREYSVVAARALDGKISTYPIIENFYEDGKLLKTVTPVKLPDEIEFEMYRITERLGASINYRGLFQLDFYVTATGNLIIKRLVATLSQASAIFDQVTNVSVYEQHIRAIAGLPLSVVTAAWPAVLVPFSDVADEKLRTQWLIKDNWHFTFYHNAGQLLHDVSGHFIATGTDVQSLLDQIDATKFIEAEELE